MEAVWQRVLEQLPESPEEQMELGFRIVRHAHQLRLRNSEINASKILERQKQQDKRVKQMLEERQSVVAERTKLVEENRRYKTELMKLDRIRTSLNDIGSGELGSVMASSSSDPPAAGSIMTGGGTVEYKSMDGGTLYGSPTATSPVQRQHQELLARINQSGAASAAGALNGKQFFREARKRLPPAKFDSFLETIKALNAHTISRDEALETAAGLFTDDHDDLSAQFRGLLYGTQPV
eukprot:g4650.t1